MLKLFKVSFLCSIVIAGCGDSSDNSKRNPEGFYPAPTEEIAKKLFDEAQVSCEDQGECHGSVGLLVAKHNESVGICSAFLTAPDTIMTNSHCVPDDLTPGASCDGYIEILFPAVEDLKKERTTCKTVMARSNHNESSALLSQDFAILKLSKEVSRPSLSLSRKKTLPGEVLSVVSMTPASSKSPVGVISRPRPCPLLGKNMLNPHLPNVDKPILFFSECNLVQGNSGSPMLDSSGAVRAIGQGYLNEEKFSKLLGTMLLEDLGQIDVGTSISCISIDSSSSGVSTECKALPKLDDMKIYLASEMNHDSALSKDFANRMNAIVKSWNSSFFLNDDTSSRANIFWKAPEPKIGSLKYQLIPVPSCFREPSTWLSAKFKRGFFGYPRSFSETHSLPQFQVSIGFNKFLELEIRTQEFLVSFPLTVTYNPNQMHADSETLTKVEISLKTVSSETIGVCSSLPDFIK